MFVDVILRNRSRFADRLFTYEISKEVEEDIKVGHRISVPFGRSNKPVEAFVVAIKSEIGEGVSKDEIKNIFDILDEKPMLSIESLRLIHWIRNRYMCTYIDALNLFYPKGYKLVSKKITRVVDGSEKTFWEYEDKKNEKKISFIRLNEDALNDEIKLGKKQSQIVEFLKLNHEAELSALKEILEISSQTVKSLEKKNLVYIREEDVYRKNSEQVYKPKNIKLNPEQEKIVDDIVLNMTIGNKKPYLIHGITGSGKTEIYLSLIDYILSQGGDCIFLVPEISLTVQMIKRVKSRFDNLVGIYHSKLSEGQKHDLYREVRDGRIRVVLGTRSSIFLPFKKLSMVIMDEQHDFSYKSEMTPKYNAVEIARYMSEKMDVALVMGSATPSVSDYFMANEGEYILYNLEKRANNKKLPEIKIVDMRKELDSGNTGDISEELFEAIEDTVSKGEQAILFLNRRGYSNFVVCKSCGYVFRCKNCDISMTYHKFQNKLMCHYCAREEDLVKTCPSCGLESLDELGVGTQKIEEVIKEKFPNYRILRLDKDTTSRKGELEKILNDFEEKKADILIGTQIISKGHDFEDVTLVGIISADMMLNYPDYRSFEMTFQAITQVAGRAGRGEKEGRVILQTYDTDHFAIKTAAKYDYEDFYNSDIKLRKMFGYEPFTNILRIVFSGKNYNKVKDNATRFTETLDYLSRSNEDFYSKDFLGPSECSINRIKNKYRWQVIIKANNIEIKTLKNMVKYIVVTKYEDIFDKDIEINVELNPNTFI